LRSWLTVVLSCEHYEKDSNTGQQMHITVKYFASLREQMGREGDVLDIEKPLLMTEVWQQVSNDKPLDNLLCSRNRQYAQWDELAEDGDEIAFFPPVTGG